MKAVVRRFSHVAASFKLVGGSQPGFVRERLMCKETGLYEPIKRVKQKRDILSDRASLSAQSGDLSPDQDKSAAGRRYLVSRET